MDDVMVAQTQPIKANRRGYYPIPDLGDLPRVTMILGAINKPALVNWAANTERELVTEAAADLHEDLPSYGEKMARTAYIATLGQRVGKTKAHQRELRKAADIGSEAHALIEWNLRRQLLQKVGPEPKVSEKALWAFMAWEDWRNKTNMAPLAIEQTVWSEKLGAAGTMDLYCEAELEPIEDAPRGKLVVDWKTGKAIYGEAKIQVAVYTEMLIEMGHTDHNTWGLIVRLPKVETDPDFETLYLSPSDRSRLVKVFQAVKQTWEWMKDEEEQRRLWKAVKKD